MAQPWPACMDAVKAAIAQAAGRSASSSTKNADLPPNPETAFDGGRSGRHHRPAGGRRAGERHHVDARVAGQHGSYSMVAGCDDVEHAWGCRCVRAATSPRMAAHQGVSGAGLRTTVLPAAKAGPILARLIWCGKFHGVMAPTTPTASRTRVRRVRMPIGEAMPGRCARVAFGRVGREVQIGHRGFQLGTGSEH